MNPKITRLVVSNIFYVHPFYLGRWSNVTSIFFKWVETINQFLEIMFSFTRDLLLQRGDVLRLWPWHVWCRFPSQVGDSYLSRVGTTASKDYRCRRLLRWFTLGGMADSPVRMLMFFFLVIHSMWLSSVFFGAEGVKMMKGFVGDQNNWYYLWWNHVLYIPMCLFW